MNRLILIFIFCISLIVLGAISGTNKVKTTYKLEKGYIEGVEECKLKDYHLRLQCYKDLIQNFLSEHPLAKRDFYKLFLPYIINPNDLSKNKELFITPLSTNCHTFLHAVGEVYAEFHSDDVEDPEGVLEIRSTECRKGDRIGVMQKFAKLKNFDDSYIERLRRACTRGIVNVGELDVQQCAHGLGHIYFDKYVFDISQLHAQTHFETKTEMLEVENIDKAFSQCSKLSYLESGACYDALTHSLFLVAHYFHHNEISKKNFTFIFDKCEDLKEFREICYRNAIHRIGVNEAGPYFLSEEYERGNSICREISRDVGSDLGSLCYQGVGKFIAQIIHEYGKTDLKSRCENVDGAYKVYCYSNLENWLRSLND